MHIRRFVMLRLVFRHELRVLIADRSLALVCGLLVLMIGYGLFVGFKQAQLRERMVAEVLARQEAAEKSNKDLLDQVLAGRDAPLPFSSPANPAAMAGGLAGRYVVLPNASLAALAIGQSDMIPNYYAITYRSKVQFMYDTEVENPWNLLAGHLDLAFVIVFVLPLLIFAISYNLLSSEREQGTLRMLCSQPLAISTLLVGKVAARAVCLLSGAAVLPIAFLLIILPATRGLQELILLLSWGALVTAYGLFWFAVAVLVNTAKRSSSANALILTAIWTVLVLIAPIAINVVVSWLSPAPSRTELASRTRVVTAESLRRYENLYSADYRYTSNPDVLTVKDGHIEVPERMRAFFLAKKDVDERIEELLQLFDQQLAAQQQWVDRFAFLSPAIIVNEAMSSVAGNGSRRYLVFKRQVESFHNAWRRYFYPRILEGRAITPSDLTSLPRWTWIEEAPAETLKDAWWRTVLMLFLAFAFGAAAFVRARRYSVA